MNKIIPAALVLVAVAAGAFLLLRDGERGAEAPAEGAPMVSVVLPETLSAEAEMGRRAYDAVCAQCHGENAAGRVGLGPPLVHEIYEPGHHGDMAFVLAVQNGVPSHHWRFGNMPAQEGLTKADVGTIIAYVRALQRANGIE